VIDAATARGGRMGSTNLLNGGIETTLNNRGGKILIPQAQLAVLWYGNFN
jgi:hypothetical protein